MPRIRLILQACAPIAHFDTRTGIDNGTNVRLAMTQPVLLDGRRVYAPHVSENALRSTLLRIPLANHLVRTLDLAGRIRPSVLNLLYAGGSMGAGRTPGNDTDVGHKLYALYPALALLGGAVDTMILPRSKLAVSAWLVAREYRDALAAVFPGEVADRATVSAFDLKGDEVRTRGTGDEAEGNQMLYGYETLAAGTEIALCLTLDPWAAPVVASAVGRALAEWDGFVGGQRRQGRGFCRIAWSDGVPGPEAYDAHIAEHADRMRAGLLDGTFAVAGGALCAA